MTNNRPTVLMALIVFALTAIGCAQSSVQRTEQPTPAAAPPFAFEGLEAVSSSELDAAFVRPGVDFGAYGQVLAGTLELAFRTPDRSQQQFALTEAQQARFRQLLVDAFTAEFKADGAPVLTNAPGPDVFVLNARVQDISAQVLPTASGPGRAAILLEAIGEATLVLELRDSQTNEILARGIDTRVTEGAAILQKSGPVTRWSEAEELCEHWAGATRRALRSLTQ
ncbi:MAG: DUF3313 family protein [Pseudomonadota bacterium]